jgi:hypothetical protein
MPKLYQKVKPVNFDRLPPIAQGIQILSDIRIASVKQQWPSNSIDNVKNVLQQALINVPLPAAKKNSVVGIAVGSRGIDQLDRVVLHCIEFLREKGFSPVLIPAMGSHGGGNASGQKEVLAALGITEKLMGVPVLASMDTKQIGAISPEFPVFFSKAAIEVDHLVIINRIKSHTKFEGVIESGLCKMLSIGLGKATGAGLYHQKAVTEGFFWIETIAQMIINHYSIMLGLALIENQNGHLSHIEAIPGKNIVLREKELLLKAKTLMPSIPFDQIDILMIDEIGKNISGIGMDSNITGRHRDIVGNVYAKPHVKRIYVRNLSEKTHGNANGIGLADVVRTQCLKTMDFEATYMNALTALSPEKAAIPIFFDTDQQCLAACLHTIGKIRGQSVRLVWIKNTGTLERFIVSEGLKSDIEKHVAVSRMTEWSNISFDACGNILEY